MDIKKLKSVIGSLLFVAGDPVKIGKIVKITGAKKAEIEEALDAFSADCLSGRGVIVMRKEDEIQLASDPQNSEYVMSFLKNDSQEGLTQSALETLSIVAYRGPITRSGIEAIRGVNSSFTVRSLLMRGLLERMENPADTRSYLYKISFDFLKKLGVDSVEKLPDWEDISQDPRVEDAVKLNQE